MRAGRIAWGVLLAAVLFVTVAGSQEEEEAIVVDEPTVVREFRAAWVATVANIDWPSRKDLTSDEQKAEMIAILDKAVELNLNAIIFQVRPMCDALYASNYEPWSEFLTGQLGKPPEPFYDPLEFAIREAHERGLELHAWFNPYRALHPGARSPIPPNHISRTHPEVVKRYGNYLWLDPGEPRVQDHSLAVILDVVRRYDVDGVHLDDYFYPYQVRDSAGQIVDFPDGPSWERYRASGGPLSRDDWRRDNVNQFVRRWYERVKAEKPWVKVGISPFGIWRPGYPEGVKGLDQYAVLYADAKLWLESGWVDYFTPQLYWSLDSEGQPYRELLRWWVEQNAHGRHIWPGNYTSKVTGKEDGWPAEEIVNQVLATREIEGASGNVHFSMKALLHNWGGISDALASSVYAEPALVPASPWLNEATPSKPKLTVFREGQTGNLHMAWNVPVEEEVWLWALYEKREGKWTVQPLPAGRTINQMMRFRKAEVPEEVAVSAINRCGVEGPRNRVVPPAPPPEP